MTSGLLVAARARWVGGVTFAVLSLLLGGCDQAAAGGNTDSTSRSGCPTGATPLQPRTLVQDKFTGLAWGDGDVIATSNSDVRAFPANGDPPSTLVHMGELDGVVIAGSTAYFSGFAAVGTDALFSVPSSGGIPTLVAEAPINMNGAVTDGTAIYFNGWGGGIIRIAIADGAATKLSLSTSFIVHALSVYAGELYLAVQDLTDSSGSIVKLPATGGDLTTLASDLGQPTAIAVGPSGLYWVEWPLLGLGGDARIARAGLDGLGVTTLVAHGANSIVLDGDTLYIAYGGISRVPATGGSEVTLVPNLEQPGLLAISNGNAAWVDPVSQAKSDPSLPSLVTICW